MSKRAFVTAALFVLVAGAAPAFAQGRVEVSGFVGFSLNDGVDSESAIIAGDGNIYDNIEPKDSAVYGFTVGFLVGEGAEVGFRWASAPTTLQATGTNDREIGDMSMNSYHGYFAYNFGETDARMRPFVLIGLGVWLVREPVLALSSDDPAVRALALGLLIYICLYQLFDAVQTVAAHALRGYKVTLLPMALHTLCFWGVGMGLGYWLSFHAPWRVAAPSVAGFWEGGVLATVLASVLFGALLRLVMRRNGHRAQGTLHGQTAG